MAHKTFWMSFAGEEGFRGVCVVDVTDKDVESTPRHPRVSPERWANEPDTRWLAAAHRIAWMHGCNPGGQILTREIDPDFPAPRFKLLTRAELELFGERGPRRQ